MADPECSIVIPARNEAATIGALLDLVLVSLPANSEVIVVDDGSTDETASIVQDRALRAPVIRVLRRPVGAGKGAALRAGIEVTRGRYVLFQDADLELDPSTYPELLRPLRDGRADVVYGSRFLRPVDAPRMTVLANRVLTGLTNLLYGTALTDMETGHKAFTGDLIRSLTLRADGFDIEPEVTARIARRRARIVEVPTAYRPRTREEGKRIGFRDGWVALRTLVRYRFGG